MAQAVAHTTLVDSLDPVRGVVANVIVTIDPGAISHEMGERRSPLRRGHGTAVFVE